MTENLDKRRRLRLLGRAIGQIRSERQITIPQLALAVDVPATRIRALEAGRLDPDYELLLALAQALHVDPSALVMRAEALALRDEGDHA